MGPKKAAPAEAEAGKRTKEKITLEMKKEIIRKHDGGVRVTDLAREYRRNPSTIGTTLKMREKILATDVAKGVARIMKNRPAGWKRSSLQGPHVVRHGEAASSDVPVAEEFATEFLEVVKTQGYLPQQVFNCDETRLFWKRVPKRTFLTQEETKLPGHKPMKDCLTLLFWANASGDLKIKPMLVYQSENPRAFKKHKVNKDQLSVLWRSNAKAWVTHVLFVDWVNLAFGPAVKQYLLDNDLPLKAVLLMDNAPVHPPGLEEDLSKDFCFIKIMSLLPNTTPLLQPMDQQAIANFKKLYTNELFRRCFEVTDRTNLTLRDFWRKHFDIASCVKMITMAWDGISQRILNSTWRNLWSDWVPRSDSDVSAPESTVLEDIVSLGRTMGLEVTEEDVCELVEDHDQELSIQELVKLQAEATQEQTPLEEEEVPIEEQLSSTELKDICQLWENVQTYARRHHPDKALARDLSNTFDTRIMSSFRGVLKRRLKQQTMERFIMKKQRVEEEPAAQASQPETVPASSTAPSTS
ncbi:tigger transposable element-derived protein 1-like [Zootoca vivipara]|uniref:tigger transposable element-derived protein 1-like n=1 Tax=Zootoca vivipara TaxID=8524 RepID=UPI00293B9D05|nr:tigger transposable element-derived protein 1-like [Zootoca vivipara]